MFNHNQSSVIAAFRIMFSRGKMTLNKGLITRGLKVLLTLYPQGEGTPHISGRGRLARYLGVLIYQHDSIVRGVVFMRSELIVWGFDS